MFSRDDAVELRANLGPIEFAGPSNLSSLAIAYSDHYGLRFNQHSHLESHRIGIIESSRFQLVCQYFSVSIKRQRGTVFLVHGYFDHAGLYGNLIKYCLMHGLAVVVFDLPGHGLSSGKLSSIESFNQYSEAFLSCVTEAGKQLINKPRFAIGQSMGAAVLINCIIEKIFPPQDFDHIILLAPLLYPRKWNAMRFLFPLVSCFFSSMKRNFSTNSHDQEFLDFLRTSDSLQSKNLPVDWLLAMVDYQKRFAEFPTKVQKFSIIQGTADETVDWKYNIKKIEEKFIGSKVYLVNGGMHHLVNESKDYREHVFSLINLLAD